MGIRSREQCPRAHGTISALPGSGSAYSLAVRCCGLCGKIVWVTSPEVRELFREDRGLGQHSVFRICICVALIAYCIF